MPEQPFFPNALPAAQGWRRRRWLGLAGGLVAGGGLPVLAWAQAGRPRKAGRAARPVYPLAAGRSFWLPELAPAGPVVAVVNLHTQHVQVYRNGVAIGYSSASTGKPGHGTPVGLFSVLEKQRHHRSSIYNNAPMPWMVRLTWGGIAFHGGPLPGYPASHGCIRLPMDFAPRLFGALQRGSAVAVVRQAAQAGHGSQMPLPMLAPIDPQGKPLLQPEMLSQPLYWAPTLADAPASPSAVSPAMPAASAALAAAAAAASMPAAGAAAPVPAATPAPAPLALLASLSQQRLFVLKQGRVLASAALPAAAQAPVLQGRSLFQWSASGQWQAIGDTADVDASLWRDVLPTAPAFAQRLRAALIPGSTLLASPLPAVSEVHSAVWRL